LATNERSDPVLYSSTDGTSFSKIQFPPDVSLKKGDFTILLSNTGVFLEIAKNQVKGQESGTIFKSTEDGKSFSEIIDGINRSTSGVVDFIQFPGLEGIVLSNVVTLSQGKNIRTKITFNDGLSWSFVEPPLVDSHNNPVDCTGECGLQIHLQSSGVANGMLSPFGTEQSLGLMLAVGNIGTSLDEYKSGNMYLTRDGGKTWKEIKKEPHKWAIADYGGLLVLVNSEKPMTTLSYSWDFGISWADYVFSNESITIESIVSHEGTNKVLISGHSGLSEKTISILVDFSTLFTRVCDRSKVGGSQKDDFETWSPLNDSGCYFGLKTDFYKRRSDSVCSVGPGFTAIKQSSKTCECSEMDYECAPGYFRNDVGGCYFFGLDPNQPKGCKTGTKYKSTQYRKLSTTKCKGGKDLTIPVEIECGSEKGPDKVNSQTFFFEGFVDSYFYFKNTNNILVKDSLHKVYLSEDNSLFRKILEDDIVSIVDDVGFPNRAFVVTVKGEIWVTDNAGKDFKKIDVDGIPDISLSPEFLIPHPTEHDWLIWIGAQNCEVGSSNCHTVAKITFNYGYSWKTLTNYAYKCSWGVTKEFRGNDKMVFCAVFNPQSGNQRSLSDLVLKRSIDASDKFTELFPTAGFAFEHEYLIVAMVY
jgi:hypothetical protein